MRALLRDPQVSGSAGSPVRGVRVSVAALARSSLTFLLLFAA